MAANGSLRPRTVLFQALVFMALALLAPSPAWCRDAMSNAPPSSGDAPVPPPAPLDTRPALRADQIHQMQRASYAGKAASDVKAVGKSPAPAVNTGGRAKATGHVDTGLKVIRFQEPRTGRTVEAQADQMLVRFSPRLSRSQAAQALARHKLSAIKRRAPLLDKIGYQRVGLPAGAAIPALLRDLRADAAIERAEANFTLRSQAYDPQDPSFSPDWGIKAIRAREAWSITAGAPAVIVAVVDSGVDEDHPALAGRLARGYNFVSDNYDVDDDCGHGTHVAGIVAAREDAITGAAGVAPHSTILPLKVLDANGEGTAADVAEAVIYAADSGARVVLLALGTYAESGVLSAAVDYAAARNCVIVAAAGNNGSDEPAYPAACASALAVAAIDQFAKPCIFSNHGPCVDVAAPGMDILTTSAGGSYETVEGTSVAAAHVAGLAALLIAKRPELNAESFHGILQAGSGDLMAAGWDASTGFGLVDCVNALGLTHWSAADAGIVEAAAFPLRPAPGQACTIAVSVRNHATGVSRPGNLVLSRNGLPLSAVGIPEISPGRVHAARLEWIPAQSDAGSITLHVQLEAQPAEDALADNGREVPLDVSSQPHRDLAVLQTRAVGAPLSAGTQLVVEVTLANLGNVAQTEAVFRHEGLGNDRAQTLSLAPGETRTVVTEWTLPDDSPGPDELLPVYAISFSLDPAGNEDAANNRSVLKLGHRRSHGEVIPFHGIGDAYSDNQYVHQWLADEAYKYFTSQVEGADLEYYLGTISGSFSTGDNDLLEGTFAEDRASRDPLYQGWINPWDPDHPSNRHFCQGADGAELEDGLAGYSSAYQQALSIWNGYATADYPANKPRAYYRFGHVVHLLEDMTVPAHTHNDEHPISEPYEDAMAYAGQFKYWYYGCTRSGLASLWNAPLSIDYSSLHSIFYRTANYTEDYDSGDDYGDVSAGAAPYSPGDYPGAWHRPGEVNRSDGMSSTELTITADDLMPYAIRRVADLYRYWYKTVDATGPTVSMTFPSSQDVANPDLRGNFDSFDLAALAVDPESGVLKMGYQFKWAWWTGSAWSSWYDVAPSPTAGSVPFTPSQGETWYAFCAIAENGGGRLGWCAASYLRIDAAAPSNPDSCSESHAAPSGAWQNGVSDPAFTWSGASGAGGVAGYYWYFGGDASADPSTWTATAGCDPSAVPSGVYYLRVKTRDAAGNVSDPVTLFTFAYDGGSPSNPASWSESHGVVSGDWQRSTNDPAFTWSGASDGHSGVKGYYWYFGVDSGADPGTWTTSAACDPPPVSSGTCYLRVKTEDNAGNVSGALTLFTFRYDSVAPANPSAPAVETGGTQTDVWQNTVSDPAFTWTAATDAHSGVKGYYWYFGADPSATPSAFTAIAACDPPAVTQSVVYYLRVSTEDHAGNKSSPSTLFTFKYSSDSQGPQVDSAAAVPGTVREAVDLTLTLAARASDAGAGDSNVAAAEYYIGADPGEGNGAAMSAADGAFDSAVEALTAVVDASTSEWRLRLWPGDAVPLHIRARDSGGNWGAGVELLVPIVDGTPPSAAQDLNAAGGPGFTKILTTDWTTLGSVAPAEEVLVLDLGSVSRVGAVAMTVPETPLCFPIDFSIEASPDAAQWTPVGKAVSFGRLAGIHLWQCAPLQYRYVRIKAATLLDPSDGHYYVRIPEITVYESLDGNSVTAAWTATADDDNNAASGPAAVYDLRYSASAINEANWGAATPVDNEPAPLAAGASETCTFSAGNLTTVYVGLKIGDEAGNWSTIATSWPAATGPAGFASIAPPDATSLSPAAAAPTFQFRMDADAQTCFISFSGCAGFPPIPTMGEDGQMCSTLRFALTLGAGAWTPTATQWTAIKKLVHTSGALYWRVDGACSDYAAVYGPSRTLLFDCGDITGLTVNPHHYVDGEQAVWPVRPVLPVFYWTNSTNGMASFFVDVSTDPAFPLSDTTRTVILGGKGIPGASYMATATQWKKMRQLATWAATSANPEPAEGTLYWRVRALSADKSLTCASATRIFIVDGGTWTVEDLDLSAPSPTVRWRHEGLGIVAFKVQFSADADFPPDTAVTVTLPTGTVTAEQYALTATELTRLRTLAQGNGVSTLHYRIRGDDVDKAFMAYSPSESTPAP